MKLIATEITSSLIEGGWDVIIYHHKAKNGFVA